MAKLDPLIRVRKHAVEEKQKFLAELFRQAEELDGQKAKLLAQLKKERLALQDNNTVDGLVSFGHYSDAVHGRVQDIDEERKTLEVRIQHAQDEIRTAFSELKKIEIIHERRVDEEKAQQNKKESQGLDDIAIESFTRKAREK